MRTHADDERRDLLNPWPVREPSDWVEEVNAGLSREQQAGVQVSLARGRPYGDAAWLKRMVGQLGLEHTVRPEGRPRRKEPAGKSIER